METTELQPLAEKALWPGMALFALRLRPMGKGFLIQVELDGLNDPVGSVTLDECERFSKAFIELLDAAITGGHLQAGAAAGLTEENYSLEVSSAGAERELRLPDDLERFRGRPLKIRSRKDDGKVHVGHGIFDGFESGQVIRLLEFVPGKKKVGKTKARPAEPYTLELGKIEKVNLFLDV